ncbi:hypothetical protein ACOMHN_033411 [Nucella lapillus]
MADRKRVAIIGAGCSGLTAIKCCVDEGLEPVCFERTDHFGGLWRYTEKVKDGQGSVMKSTVINTSKEMMCYSDFPIPKEYPNFMHNTLVYEYFKDYMKHFQLEQYIRYNVEVKGVSPKDDFRSTGRWTVEVEDHSGGGDSTTSITSEVFDAVMVCSGHHADRYLPSFPGLADFQGQVIHSHDYKEPSGFVGKRVVIVGIGNSGGDMAVELSRVGQVYLSTRHGSWILNRIGPHGMPLDIVLSRRITQKIVDMMPSAMMDWVFANQLNGRLNHDLYSLRPAHAPFAQHPTVNDDLGNRIVCGSVVIKPDVKLFTASGVEFVDGTIENNIDVVVLATGYKFGFPFLDPKVAEVKENRLPFFKYMFPPDLDPHTLAVIGYFQPMGAIMPISELQCRLATRVFKGDAKLPSSSQMWEDIQAKEAAMAKRYISAHRHTIQVDFIPFMDELAELNGCKPHVVSLLMTDPRLGLQVMCGPCTPCQYRLRGPGQWQGARQAILTTMDRLRYPLSTRPLPPSAGQGRFFLWAVAVVVVLLVMRYIFL